ncbi:group II intron reverse transcriptase/maturase [Mulberry dwarf phytoplasma]|uniref:group II intron reverse transcriptase/maturase n=1 Tax=Mulberry dwarf phytoplasma TaxID=186171 RepID=UPI001D0FECAC|nr:group II intron reverse transcriptase/maturase [Mulberry dwarf phytoplasma]
MQMQPTEADKASKLSNLLNRIQTKSLNKITLKKELQQGMNSLDNITFAFNKVAGNDGAGTHGTDGQTIDGKDWNYIIKLNDKYRNNQYRPKPLRRVYIPKPNGDKRPLGIPTIDDRIIQQAMYQLLNPFYEVKFSKWSYGFRPDKSPHDAIKRIKDRFKGIKWLIKIDIKGFFDTINHDILLKIFNEDIRKAKTLKTIKQWLEAGIMDNWVFQKTFSGTPQGGIISPLLANVYLHEVDEKMEKLVVKGTPKRKSNPKYKKIQRLGFLRKAKVASDININPNIRVEYIRYADDFIIGCTGTIEQANELKQKVVSWLVRDLGLSISYDKSKIVPAHKGTKFLSYLIRVNPTASSKNKSARKSLNGKTDIRIPKEEIDNRCQRWVRVSKKKTKIIHNSQLHYRDELEIIQSYKRIVEGIIRYFAYGRNLSQLIKLAYFAEYSCLMTIAGKYKTSIARVRKKLNRGQGTWGVKYTKKTKPRYETWPKYTWDRIKRMRRYKDINPDIIPNPNTFLGRTRLTDRLKAEKCEGCQRIDNKLEIHHAKTVRNRNWQSVMNKLTMVLCKKCHRRKTNEQIKSFKNIKRKINTSE